MALSLEDIEGYLQKLDRRYEKLDGTLLVSMGHGQSPVALLVVPPVAVLQVGITEAPKDGEAGERMASNARLFRKLLELNANDLVHAAYGLEGDRVVLAAALDIDNLGLTELEAVLADMDMALANHVPVLRGMIEEKE